MGWSIYAKRKLTDHVLQAPGGGAYTQPTHLYLGLSTTPIASDGTGITEPVGNNYSRLQVDGKFATATAAEPVIVSSNAVCTLPNPSGGWGHPTDWFLSDASTVGNMLLSGKLNDPVDIGNGDAVSFAAGELTARWDSVA